MKLKFILPGLALMFISNANAIDFGVGVKAGTLGVGADFSILLTPTINARLSLTKANYDLSETIEINDANNTATIDADINFDVGAQAILFDWYVFDGTFHMTAGMVKNDSAVNMTGILQSINGTSSVTFNNETYSLNDFVNPSMGGRVSFGNSFEPYLGIGWGRKASVDPGLSLSVEIGVVLLDPSVDLDAPQLTQQAINGGLSQSDLDADVDAAEQTANTDLDDLEAWPVLSIGLNYAF
jgi:hypothetical protein